jgi:two-component system NtrC family response regulator
MRDRRTILVIEDDDSIRRVIEFGLQEAGYNVLAATDGVAGLDTVTREQIDLVISDLRMPQMDGLELLAHLKAMNADLPVLMLTAHASIDTAVEAMKLGAFDFLTKPFELEHLRQVVAKALDVAALRAENRHLREVIRERFSFEHLIAGSRAMRAVTDMAARVAPSDATVLLEGESGTGKEVLAKAIHLHSSRSRGPFVAVNCGAIPEALLESELFGHRRGAFTGAVADRVGKFEAANKGTIFLDEIGELPLNVQVKLLRVLQEREVDKLGESHPVKVDVRVIAATNRDIEKMVSDHTFRDDLYYRLAVVPLRLPPLRERTDDIPFLVEHFLTRHVERHGGARPQIDASVYAAFSVHSWPGNVRELENVLERALVLDTDQRIGLDDLSERFRGQRSPIGRLRLELPDEGLPLEEVERDLIKAALEKHGWNQTKAAAYLDVTRSTLIYRMQKFGLDAPRDVREP